MPKIIFTFGLCYDLTKIRKYNMSMQPPHSGVICRQP